MRFTETELAGALMVDLERHHDDRGFFARAYCTEEFAEHGVELGVRQANLSWTGRRGTIRGFHFQFPPAEETKFIRCVRGAIFDVVVDLRPESPTFLRTAGVELDADTRRGFVVPRRCGHAFQTLRDDSEVLYLASAPFSPGEECGVRWDDPDLDLTWPAPVTLVSDKDASWPLLRDQRPVLERRMVAEPAA
jgi:dTDP-4-dehydrorhamnose 3,5-epimerase